MNNQDKARGFTIVELLIVIVVIAILAAISIVAFTGIQERASTAAADAALTQTARKLAVYKTESETHPSSLSEIDIEESTSAELDYTVAGDGYCLSATVGSITRSISAASQTPNTGGCEVALTNWAYSGGATYNGALDQIHLSHTQSGSAIAPLVATEGKARARISVETFATMPSQYHAPDSGMLFGSRYYASDGVTLVANTTGHTSNGSASCRAPMSTWTTCTWTVFTGPGIEWVRFTVSSSPNNYTSNNIVRNVQITALD